MANGGFAQLGVSRAGRLAEVGVVLILVCGV